MIGLPEVQRIAYRSGVSERMIERDYILTWALIGLARHPIMGSSAALKGGTALKKLYFTDWRYSEDLDFTVQPVVAPDVLQGYLTAAGRTVHDETGIEFEVMSSEPRWDGPTLRNVTFYLGYVGPLHRTRRWRELKLDFTFDEVLVNPPVRRPLLATYSADSLSSLPRQQQQRLVPCAAGKALLLAVSPSLKPVPLRPLALSPFPPFANWGGSGYNRRRIPDHGRRPCG
jgi:hypothetical protein